MAKKQLMLLFTCSLVPWTMAAGYMPILPIYLLQFGISQVEVGYLISICFGFLAVGTFFAGWLADRFQHRKIMLIVCGSMLIPLYWAIGQVEDFWSLAVLMLSACFFFGALIALISILTGLFAGKDERGRVLGIIGMTAALGAIIGGFCIGPIADRWGYTTMFTVVGLCFIIPPIVGIFIEDRKVIAVKKSAVSKPKHKINFGKAFFILLSAHLIAFIVYGIGSMGRSMAMINLDFTAASITSTATVAGFISLPFPFFLGWLSDRFGRKRLLIICYTSFVLCMIVFAVSKSLWHFWIAACLLRIGNVGKDVGAAYITDIVNPETLGRGMSLFQAMYWIGQMIGYAVAGLAFENLGLETALFLSAALSTIAVILAISISVAKQQRAAIERKA